MMFVFYAFRSQPSNSAWSSSRSVLLTTFPHECLARDLHLQPGVDKAVDVAVEHGAGVAGFIAGALVLDELVGLQHIVADAAAEACLDVDAAQRGFLRLALLQLDLVEFGTQDAHRRLPILKLAALVLAAHDDAGGQVRQAHGGGVLLHVLAAGPP